MFPQKSSEVPETFLSTNTYISQQRNEDKTDNYQHITPLDITDTQQLTKSSSSNFLNRTVKKPIRMFKNNKNHLSQREFDINTKPFNKKKSLSQLPLKVLKLCYRIIIVFSLMKKDQTIFKVGVKY